MAKLYETTKVRITVQMNLTLNGGEKRKGNVDINVKEIGREALKEIYGLGDANIDIEGHATDWPRRCMVN